MLAFRCAFVLLLLLLGGHRHAWAQRMSGLFEMARPEQQKARITFLQQRNFIILTGRINGSGPYNFLLDTGTSMSLITSPKLADSLGLRRGTMFRVVGAGGQATGLLAYQTDSVRLTLPGVVAPAMSMLILSEDVLNLSGYVGMPIHGILGPELFQSFVVTVLPQQRRLLLQRTASFVPPRNARWTSMPLSLENNKAYLTTPIQISDSLTLPLKLVLDTGAGHALSLEAGSDPRLQLPTQRLATELGQGLTGVVRGSLGRVASLQLGRYHLESVLTSFPDLADVHSRAEVHRNGNLGFELLKRFSLIIDYPHQRLWLRPNLRFTEPFEHDMSGLELLAVGPALNRFIVLRVTAGSAAATAGIGVDDELVSINLMPVSAFTLTQLSDILHSTDGRALIVELRQPNGKLRVTILRLKRQI